MLMVLPQLLVSGISTGMLYGLIALSMAVAYAIFVFAAGFGLPFVPALLVAIALLFLMGAALNRFLMRPIMAGPHLSLAMMALAAGYALRGAARLEWGSETLHLQRPYEQVTFLLGQVVVTMDDLVITGVVLLLLLVFFVVFHLTPAGKIVQAVFQTQRGAALVGINVGAFHDTMWGVGSALAAVGGALLALIVTLSPDIGA